MTDYTPTTGRVRRCYAQERIREGAPPPESRAEFDRWLAEYTREQREIGWDQAEANYYITKNPYRKA